MGRQPRQFLVDVDLVDEQRDFLAHPFVVGGYQCFLQPRVQFFLEGGDDRRNARLHDRDAAAHFRGALQDHRRQLRAFSCACCGEFTQRLTQQFARGCAQFIAGQVVGTEHAGPAQDIGHAQRACFGECCACARIEFQHLREQRGVEFRAALRAAAQRVGDPAFDFAAGHRARDGFAQGLLGLPQFIRHAE